MSRRPVQGFDRYNWAWDQPLPAGPKLVLLALVKHADEHGACYPKQSTIAELTGVSRRAVRYHLAELEALGLIVRDRRRRKDGTRAADHYILTMRQAATIAAGSDDEPDGEPVTDDEREHEDEAQAATIATSATDHQAATIATHKRQPLPVDTDPQEHPTSTVTDDENASENADHQAATIAAQELTTLRTDHKELTTLSQSATATAGEPPRPRPTPRRESEPLREADKAEDQAQTPELTPTAEAFAEAWNEHRGDLPRLLKLNEGRRAAVAGLLRQYGDEALPMFRAAAAWVAAREDYWQEKRYGFDVLAGVGQYTEKVLTYWEKHANEHAEAEAAAARRRENQARLEAFDLEPAQEYPDVEPGDLLDGANVEGTFTAPTRARKPAGLLGPAPAVADYYRSIGRELPAVSSNGSPEPQPERNPEVEHHEVEQAEPAPPAEPPKRRELTKDEREAKEAAARAKLAKQGDELRRREAERAAAASKGAE